MLPFGWFASKVYKNMNLHGYSRRDRVYEFAQYTEKYKRKLLQLDNMLSIQGSLTIVSQ